MNQEKAAGRPTFEEQIGQGVTLIDFNASWCGPCRAQKSILEDLAETYKDRVTVSELDVDENREAAMKLGIASIPTLILYKERVEVERFVGLQARETLATAIESVLKRQL